MSVRYMFIRSLVGAVLASTAAGVLDRPAVSLQGGLVCSGNSLMWLVGCVVAVQSAFMDTACRLIRGAFGFGHTGQQPAGLTFC